MDDRMRQLDLKLSERSLAGCRHLQHLPKMEAEFIFLACQVSVGPAEGTHSSTPQMSLQTWRSVKGTSVAVHSNVNQL